MGLRLSDLLRHPLGTCLGCGKEAMTSRGLNCSSECGPKETPRALELIQRGVVKDWQIVPADDPEALGAAEAKLEECAKRKRGKGAMHVGGRWTGRRPKRYVVSSVDVGGEVLVWLDCDGYTDVPYVARGLEVCWEPLLAPPVYERRGPPAEGPCCTDDPSVHHPPPTLAARLANGFAMLQGYENSSDRRDCLR